MIQSIVEQHFSVQVLEVGFDTLTQYADMFRELLFGNTPCEGNGCYKISPGGWDIFLTSARHSFVKVDTNKQTADICGPYKTKRYGNGERYFMINRDSECYVLACPMRIRQAILNDLIIYMSNRGFDYIGNDFLYKGRKAGAVFEHNGMSAFSIQMQSSALVDSAMFRDSRYYQKIRYEPVDKYHRVTSVREVDYERRQSV